MDDAPPLPQAPTSGGFTAVNSGFTAVNSSSNGAKRSATSEPTSFTPDPKRFDSPTSSAKNTPDIRGSSLKPTALKRQLSGEESSDSGRKDIDMDDSEAASSRRSKRLKKGMLKQFYSTLSASISIVAFQFILTLATKRRDFNCDDLFHFSLVLRLETNIDRCCPHCGWIAHDAIPSFSAKNTTRRTTTTRREMRNLWKKRQSSFALRILRPCLSSRMSRPSIEARAR